MIKRIFAILFSLALLLQTQSAEAGILPSKVVYSDFADVSITVGSKEFKVHAMKKNFNVIPFTVGALTYVQADNILPWPGYSAKFDLKKKVLTVSSAAQNFIIKADSLTYTLNGKTSKFSKAPKVMNGKLMVPMEELFKSLGYTVLSNKLAKTVRILKFRRLNLGSIAFYDKGPDNQNFYRFDSSGIFSEACKDMTITQLYSYKGVIIGYAYDRLQRVNKLIRYDNGKFSDLKLNFDIVSTYEFGDSRVFYGYDNKDKKYKLYRFNGTALTLVADDCYSSIQVNFNNSIILNKYDSNRNYSVVKVDPHWNVVELDTGKTMTEYFISDNWLYIKARPQEGTGLYFLVFNGTSIVRVALNSSSISKSSAEINFKDIRICDGKVYAVLPVESVQGSGRKVVSRKLHQLEGSTVIKLPYDPYDSNFTLMEAYNGKLYLSGSHQGSQQYTTFEYTPGGTYNVINDSKFSGKNLMFQKSRVEYGTLFLTGKLINPVDGSREDIMYVHQKEAWNYAMDVVSIESVVETANGIYLNVKDYDRAAPNIRRDSVVFINSKQQISNAAIDFNITNQSVAGNSLVFAGANKITKRSEVNRHNGMYDELIPGFGVMYWELINGRVFTGGKQDLMYSLYTITGTGMEKLKENFDTKAVLATRNANFYLVYGIERDKTSVYRDSRVIYLYDMQNKTFSLVTAGVDVKQILLYK
jgi:hypothetical protein